MTYPDKLSSTNKTILPYPPLPIRFKTFPDPGLGVGNRFRFVVSSCSMPNFPYLPFQGRRIRGFDLLARYLFPKGLTEREPETSGRKSLATTVGSSGVLPVSAETMPSLTTIPPPSRNPSPAAEFLLFLGDFIYADMPTYVGDSKEAYRRLYRRNYQSSSFRKIYERLRQS
jgi:alkaline phosphatase D